MLTALARDASLKAQHQAIHRGERRARREGCQAHLHSLGLPLRICSAYCAAMLNVVFPQRVQYEAPGEIEALLLAHQHMLETSPSKGCSHAARLGTMMRLGHPAGSLLSCGEVWAVTDFTFEAPSTDEAPDGELARSQWHWLDVPRLVTQIPGTAQPVTEALRLGVQLQADVALGTCLRPEIRCVLLAPTTAWVVLQAVAATPGINFELGLAAGGFDAYGDEDAGRYFPREEYSWRSPRKESDDGSQKSYEGNEIEADRATSDRQALRIRVLLLVCSAIRPPLVGRQRRMKSEIVAPDV